MEFVKRKTTSIFYTFFWKTIYKLWFLWYNTNNKKGKLIRKGVAFSYWYPKKSKPIGLGFLYPLRKQWHDLQNRRKELGK